MNDAQLKQIGHNARARMGLPAMPEVLSRMEMVRVACATCGEALEVPALIGLRPPRLVCAACVAAEASRKRQQAEEAAQKRREAERERREAELAEIRLDLSWVLEERGVPRRLSWARLALLPDLPTGLVNRLRDLAAEPEGMVTFSGPPGSGKTAAAVAVLAAILHDGLYRPEQVWFTSEAAYLAGLRATFDDDRGRGLPAGGDVRGAAVLVLDDLAATRLTEWGRAEIAELIAYRHAEYLPTLVTTNLSLDALAVQVDGRTASRLAEDEAVLQFPARDLRTAGRFRGRPPAAGWNVADLLPPDVPRANPGASADIGKGQRLKVV